MGAKKIQSLDLNLNTDLLKHSDTLDLTKFVEELKAAALALQNVTADFQAKPHAVDYWHNLVCSWAEDPTMPLYIRKSEAEYGRGAVIEHQQSKRILICTDNGPAHWSLCMAINENFVNLTQVRSMIESDAIPIAFALSKREKESKYQFCKHEVDQPNQKGWKVAHINGIGLHTRQPASQIPIEVLKTHFINFLSPANMFLVPIKFGGLAEVAEVIEIFKRLKHSKNSEE